MSPMEPLSPREEERLARYRASAMAERERAEFEREVLESDALAEALYGEQSLDAVRSSSRAARPAVRPAWAAWVAAAAGLAFVAYLGVRLMSGPGPDLTRGGPSASGLPEARVGILTWPRIPGATQYRVSLLDASGQRIDAPVVSDTSLRLPVPLPGQDAAAAFFVTPLSEDGIELPALPLTPIDSP